MNSRPRAVPRSPLAAVLRAAAGLAVTAALLGGGSGPAAAQEKSVVPQDRSTIVERADRARAKGDTGRPLVILEVSDFECPYCRRHYRQTYPALDSLYVQTGKARYVFIVYPSSSHRRAAPAAEAAHCAGAVGKFWPMHDLLFERQSEWTEAGDPLEVFVGYAARLGIDEASYRRCLEQDLVSQLVVRDLEQVARARISSTPFFIINQETAIRGARSVDRFRTVLDSLLEAR